MGMSVETAVPVPAAGAKSAALYVLKKGEAE